MAPQTLLLAFVLSSVALAAPDEKGKPAPTPDDISEKDPQAAAAKEAELVTRTRQLTFEGRRAGEGYFSRDARQMVFQSERAPGNPFFQIYLLDLRTGDTQRVSPGQGKATCAWMHPDGKRVLFSSTHEDPDAKKKQEDEFKAREAGQERRYGWDYDERYEIYAWDRSPGSYTKLTNVPGYDAEGSWSPDGGLIAFASNRQAYIAPMNDEEKKAFQHDPAYMNDIYVMNGDGANVRRLTTEPGYDGGPFFSADGRRLCWRRFSRDGATAEIMTMNADGSDSRQLTRMGHMSWAPFFHPSGRYLVFTTNRHGFNNFELYLVDAEGKREPIRVTFSKGFDGLPAFSPDGRRLTWTSNRAANQSQIFVADWNHAEALKRLGLDSSLTVEEATASGVVAAAVETTPDFSPDDLRRHVEFLCRPELGGRKTGAWGEQLATAYVAGYMQRLGLQPGGDDGTYFQKFEFMAGVGLGSNNTLVRGDAKYEVNKDWLPVAFSKTGAVDKTPVVFVGYGFTAPKTDKDKEYDSFANLDVKDKWVLAFRNLPEGMPTDRRQQLSRFAMLRFKAIAARDHGARGLIVVTGPNSKLKEQLAPLQADGALSGTALPVVSVTDAVAEQWLAPSGKKLKELQDALEKGEPVPGFPLKDVELSATIDIHPTKLMGRNVLGWLRAGDRPTEQAVVVGAHIDHIGTAPANASLAKDEERKGIHFGADDNASGTAAVLEIAEHLTELRRQGQLPLRRDVLFAAWSGEEMGLLGSAHFVKTYPRPAAKPAAPAQPAAPAKPTEPAQPAAEKPNPAAKPDQPPAKPDQPPGKPQDTLYPAIVACLNLDMVGRLDKNLMIYGAGTSHIWRSEIERANVPIGLPLKLQDDGHLPTDSTVFLQRGVPVLAPFTGIHGDYHSPRDTPDKLNYPAAAKAAWLTGVLARSVATREVPPDFVVVAKAPPQGKKMGQVRVYFGTTPDFSETDVKGVKLSGVAKGGPAEKAGVAAGDIIVEVAGRKVENIYDYTAAMEPLKVGQPVKIVVQRGDKRLTLDLTPGARD